MSRLIDRILRDKDVPAHMKNLLADCTLIVCDNVVRYFFEGTDQEYWSVHEDFPNVAPPLPMMWMEARAPLEIVSKLFGNRRWRDAHPGVEGWGVGLIAHDWDPATDYRFEAQKPDGSGIERAMLRGVRWWVEAVFFLDMGRGTRFKDGTGGMRFPVAEDGQWYSVDGKSVVKTYLLTKSARDWADRGLPDGMTLNDLTMALGEECDGILYPFLLALSFMHCKNVTLIDHRPPAWQQKAAQKKKYPPLVSYKVLEIEPMKQVLRTEGKSEQVGLQKALHICRGHFKTYSDKPLFGKVKGTFWWPSTVRGSLSHGAVIKDYAVKAPRA